MRPDPHLMGARVRGVAVTVAALLLILGASPVAQAVPLSGTISTNTTWTLSGSPYSVSGLTIAAGVTLTIDPGVIVKFGPSQSSVLTVYGTVLAGSIPGEPVYFTSLKDDATGGDTNGDGAATSPARGDWSGIVVGIGGTANLQNCVLRYGGYGGGGVSAMVKLQGGLATVSGCSITESAVHGVWRLAGSLTVENTTIQGIPSYPALSAAGVGLTITGCHLTGEGSYGLYAQGSATLTGNTITPKTRFDISATAATLALNNNTFSGAVPFEFSLTDATVSLQGSGNTFTGGSAIRLTGTLNYDTSLPTPASLGATAYDIIWLAVNAGKTLTLAPGTVMKFSSPTAYLRAYGTLTAVGSPESPICFTSIKDDTAGGDSNGDGSATSPARGDWSGLIIPAGGAANLDSCHLRYGGYGGTGGTTALVKVEGGSVTMNRCSVTDSPQTGVRHTCGGLSLTDTAVERIAGAALVSYAPDGPVATGCRLLSESAYGCMFTGSATLTGNFVNKPYFSSSARRVVRLDDNTIAGPMQLSFTDSSVDLQGSNNTFTGPSHIQISGTLAYDTSLPSPASLGATAYNVIWLTLNSASPAKTLTLAPGTVMKFNSPTAYLSIYGVLQAVGTPGQPIILTSIKDDAAGGDSNGDGSATSPAKGDWSGIIVQLGAAATFDHCDLRYGAYTGSGGTLAMIKADGLSLTVRDSVISDSANYGYGIKVSAGSLDLTGTRLTRNAWGVYLNTLGSVTVKDNCFAGNAYYGLYNKRTDMTVDATLNWWGDPSGPRPLGTGDYAYDAPTNLAVSPWLVYDPAERPQVAVIVPASFELTVSIEATIQSTASIDQVRFYYDHDLGSTLLATLTQPPYEYEWTPRVQLGVTDYRPNSFGTRAIRVLATDLAGRTGSSSAQTTEVPVFARPVQESVNQWVDLNPGPGLLDWLGTQDTSDGHTGTDYASVTGTPILAARGGTVYYVYDDFQDDYYPPGHPEGNCMLLKHTDIEAGFSYYTIYQHLKQDSATVVADSPVESGQEIAESDNTGNCTGPHLHFRVERSVAGTDPWDADAVICPYQRGFMDGPR